MNISINSYISNPQGKGSAASSLKIIKTEYDARYEAMLDVHDDLQVHIYKSRNAYYIHTLIPSETTKDLSYDTVLKIDRSFQTKEANYLNWPMKVISNSPSFAFTFANTFKRNGTLIDELKSIIPSETVKEFAEVRNPYKLLGLEKSIYYACKYIKGNFHTTEELDKFSSELDLKKLIKQMQDFKEVMRLKEIDDKRKAEEKQKEKARLKKEANEKLHNREHNIDTVETKEKIKSKAKSSVSKAKKAATAKKVKRI